MRDLRALTRPLRGPFGRAWLGLAVAGLGDEAGFMGLLWFAQQAGGARSVGLLVAAWMLPRVASGPLAGVALDRLPRHLVVAADNACRAALFAAIAVLARAGRPFPLAWLLALVAAGGSLAPLSRAGMQALTPDLVEPGRLPAANAALQWIWQLAVLAGPALGGLLTARFGPSAAIAFESAAFLTCALLFLRLAPPVRPPRPHEGGGVLPGLRFLRRDRRVLGVALFTLAYFLAYGPLEAALPGFARDRIHGGVSAYGLLWAVFAAGSLAGSALFATLRRLRRPGAWIAADMCATGGLSLLLSRCASPPPAAAVMLLEGFAWGPYGAITTTALQQLVPEELRGRVFGATQAISAGGVPLGALLGGMVGAAAGTPAAIVLSGAASLAVGLAALAAPPLRRLPDLGEPSPKPSP